jgi:hypothetical protein
VQAGQTTTLPIAVSSSDGLTNLSFTLGWPTNRFTNPSLSIPSPATVSGTVQLQTTNLLVRLSSLPGQVMSGSNVVAQISFQSLAGQSSAFVNLPVQNMTGAKPTGMTYVDYAAQLGQVVVVGNVPLLQSTVVGQSRVLRLYGKVGTSYQLQSSTNLLNPAAWTQVSSYTQTNVAQSLSVSGASPAIFYRLRQ